VTKPLDLNYLAKAEQQLVGYREDRLAARGASVFHRLDGLALEARDHRHETGEQALAVQGETAGRADRADVDHLGLDADLTAGTVDGLEDVAGELLKASRLNDAWLRQKWRVKQKERRS